MPYATGRVIHDAGSHVMEPADSGADLYMFSSDYPHPEGANDPIGRFERTFGELGAGDRDLFYARNFEQMMGERVLALA